MVDATNPKMIGDANKQRIIDLIRENKISRAEIADTLNISRPAVTKNVNALLRAGIVVEGKLDDSPIGRKPLLLEFNKDFKYVMGINIRSKHVEVALADLYGTILDKELFSIASKDNPEIVYKQILESIVRITDKKNVNISDILSVGISSPGIRSFKTGGYVLNPFIKHWDRLDMTKMFREDLGIDCIISNDVEMSILGEKRKGICKDYNNIAYLKLWDGFAARFMINGQIIYGKDYAAGEIGFMTLGEDYLQNDIDVSGHLEKTIINSGISKAYKEIKTTCGFSIDMDKEYTIKELFRLKEEGDCAAKAVIINLVNTISMVIINISTVLNPEIVVLGGDLVDISDLFIDEVYKIVKNNFPFPPKIVRGKIGRDSEIAGCISAALYEADKKIQELWET